jgi:hypothetical protein
MMETVLEMLATTFLRRRQIAEEISSPSDVFFFNLCGGTLGTAAITEEIGEIKIGRGNRSTLRKSAPAQLCPPQIPHD